MALLRAVGQWGLSGGMADQKATIKDTVDAGDSRSTEGNPNHTNIMSSHIPLAKASHMANHNVKG